jgi:hypothetical protein
MGLHVWAVYDFMVLLGVLRNAFAPSGPRWLPPINPAATRAVNEITLAEESDDDGAGGHASHLELYLAAMRQVGADTGPILDYLDRLLDGYDTGAALLWKGVPEAGRDFSLVTARLADSLPAAAAAFCYGRERLLPDVFDAMLAAATVEAPLWRDYLLRHVALDGQLHGPAARLLVTASCHTDADWRMAAHSATAALDARLALWDATLAAITGPIL